MLKSLRWLAVVAVFAIPVTLLATSTEPSLANPGHEDWTPGTTTVYTAAYDRTRTVTYRCVNGALCPLDLVIVLSCNLVQGYDDVNGDCDAPPGYAFVSETFSVDPPVTFELTVCNGQLVDDTGHYVANGGFCGTPPPTTTLPADCSPGLHSHTSDGVDCHSHPVPDDPSCGDTYQTINGAGHDTHVVQSVPPCPVTTTTTTTTPVDCVAVVEAAVAREGGLVISLAGVTGSTILPSGTRWARTLKVKLANVAVPDLNQRLGSCRINWPAARFDWTTGGDDTEIMTNPLLRPVRGSGPAETMLWAVPRTTGVMTIDVTIEVDVGGGETAELVAASLTINYREEQTI